MGSPRTQESPWCGAAGGLLESPGPGNSWARSNDNENRCDGTASQSRGEDGIKGQLDTSNPSDSVASPFLAAGQGGAAMTGNGHLAGLQVASRAGGQVTETAASKSGRDSPSKQRRPSIELLRQLDDVLQPTQSVSAKLQYLLQGADHMILELQEPEVTQHGMEASWSERQDHVRKLKELHGRREGLSAAVRSSSLSTSSRYNVHLACVVLERISEVSRSLMKLIKDSSLSMGDALKQLMELRDRELRRHALSDAGDLVELVCQELRCRKLDHDTAVLLDRANLFLAEETAGMARGVYEITEGAVLGSRGLQARIIRNEIAQEGATFHGLSEQCKDLQQMWQDCSKLLAGTDEVVYCYNMLRPPSGDSRYYDLVNGIVTMATEGIDLVHKALGEAPMGMVVVEDDLLMQYWMPEAMTGLQRLVEETQLRVRHMETQHLNGVHHTTWKGIQQLQARASRLPEKLYLLVFAVISYVNDIGSEDSMWFKNIVMTEPNLWLDEDVVALQSLEQFATKVLAFVKVLLYSGNADFNHLELCRKLDDKHIMRASSSCCALVKEIRELLGIYENGGATNSISGSRQGSMSPLDSAAESEVSDLSQDAREHLGATLYKLGWTETAASEAGGNTGHLGMADLKLNGGSGTANGKPWQPEISTVTARELKIDKANIAGEGSFGKVYPGSWYRAKVAVKVLNGSRSLFESGDFWENFHTEWSACQLAHPNIVRFINVVWLHDVVGSRMSGRDARELCIVMEWCGYGDLFSLIHTARAIRTAKNERQPEPVPMRGDESRTRWAAKFFQVWDVRLEIACQVAAGMAFMHSSEFLHRDLKSQNILLALGWTRGAAGTDVEHLQAKIGDFDGARKLKEGCSKIRSNTYLSVMYQAPETLRCEDIGKPADIFSFGVVLWEIITLCEPWEEVRTEHGKFVINWILHNVPNGARLRWPSVLGSEPKLHCRKKLMRLVESCWHVDPRKRPTMEDVLTHLTSVREEEKRCAREAYRRQQQHFLPQEKPQENQQQK